MALTIERCVGEFRGVLTEGTLPTVDCLKFAVSKGLVRSAHPDSTQPDVAREMCQIESSPRHTPRPSLAP